MELLGIGIGGKLLQKIGILHIIYDNFFCQIKYFFYLCIMKTKILDKVGFFVISEPKNDELKDIIFSRFSEIISKENINEILFFENEKGLDVMYVFLDVRVQSRIFRLFKTFDILKDYQQLDSDSVLDKILSEGVNSLNDADLKILSK